MKTDDLKISYVLPFYNAAPFIADTLESLLNQVHRNFEIICVDDGSDDDIDYLRDYYLEYKEIEWIQHADRSGAAYCRNIGNNLSTGDIIAVCDAGDVYSQYRGKKIIEYFIEHPEISVIHSHVQVNSFLNTPRFIQKAIEWDGEGKPPVSHPTVAYRGEVTQKVSYHEGCIDTDFYEFFMIDCIKAGFKFGVIPEILCIKNDLTGSSHCRDIANAKEEKRKKYDEYGIKIDARMV